MCVEHKIFYVLENIIYYECVILFNSKAFYKYKILCGSLGNKVILITDDDGEASKVKTYVSGKIKDAELHTRLGFFLDNSCRNSVDSAIKQPLQSCTSLVSTNTSPVSTLTGSSDADMSRVLQDSGVYIGGSNSIGSLMSMSISEQSNSSLSPVTRRHSVTS